MTYLDTSVLAAYYLPEARSDAVQQLLTESPAAAISSLTEVEFASAVARRVRMGELAQADGRRVLDRFALHVAEPCYLMLPLQQKEYEQAREWLAGLHIPLRTLDALHLAVASSHDLTLVTADKTLAQAAQSCGIPTEQL